MCHSRNGRALYHDGRTGGSGFFAPLTPFLLTGSKAEKSAFIAACNGSWEKTFPLRVVFNGFDPAATEGTVLRHDGPNGHPFADRKEDVVAELPLTL